MTRIESIFTVLWKKMKILLFPKEKKKNGKLSSMYLSFHTEITCIDRLEDYYQLDKVIGRGEFAKVRLAYCLVTGDQKKVAIKFIPFLDSHSMSIEMMNNNVSSTLYCSHSSDAIKSKHPNSREREKLKGERRETLISNREIEIIREIHHPNIIKLDKIFKLPDSIALVLQLAEGGELFDHVKLKKRLSEEETKMFMKQICNAVMYLHDRGIVHRDLKLENILLNKEKNQIFLSDFGFAIKIEENKRMEKISLNDKKGKYYHYENDYNDNDFITNDRNDNDSNGRGSGNSGIGNSLLKTACGSPCYAAPELVSSSQNGRGYDGKLVDSWSLGIIMFAMLYGYLPFEQDESFLKTMRMNNHAVNVDGKWRSMEIANLYKYIMITPVQFPTISSLSSSSLSSSHDTINDMKSNNHNDNERIEMNISNSSRDLIRRFLDPNPKTRITIRQAQEHSWFTAITNTNINTLPFHSS